MHAPMLEDLRNRANTALGFICDENAPLPHSNDYASHLTFFTNMVTRLEARSNRARQLVEERSRSLLGRAFSRVFSLLRNIDPNFDFDATIAPLPEAIWGDLARWVEDYVDALVRAITSDDDGVVVMADEGVVVGDGDADAGEGGGDANDGDNDASGALEDDMGDVASDISGRFLVILSFTL